MLNINELCKKLRYDVLEAMCYLGFEYDVYATMPEILIIDDIDMQSYAHSVNDGDEACGGYDHIRNRVLIPMKSISNPETFYQVLCHELTHAWQDNNRLLRDLTMPNYYFRATEMEAFMVGSYMEGKMFHGKTISTLSRETVMNNMTKVWTGLQTKSLLN